LEAGTQHEVTPYAEVYGLHPNEFLFERDDCILLLSDSEWGCYRPDDPEPMDEGRYGTDEPEYIDEECDEDDEEDRQEIAEDGWVLVHND
jgi:hypothetical protein